MTGQTTILVCHQKDAELFRKLVSDNVYVCTPGQALHGIGVDLIVVLPITLDSDTETKLFIGWLETLPCRLWPRGKIVFVGECPRCHGTGKQDDADFGDISCNEWACPTCQV